MVCCGLINAPMELERTQDMHNGTVVAAEPRFSRVTEGSRRAHRKRPCSAALRQRSPPGAASDVRWLTQPPSIPRPYAHRESALGVTGPDGTGGKKKTKSRAGGNTWRAVQSGLAMHWFHGISKSICDGFTSTLLSIMCAATTHPYHSQRSKTVNKRYGKKRNERKPN